MKGERIRRHVKERYTRIAERGTSCCGNSSGCCGGTDSAREIAQKVGYTEEELSAVPDGANLGLGCGNPVALASLREGETVLDLGSGPGFDCILAARRVGRRGHVIGVDMTPEMVSRARENARKAGIDNVEFRLGEIEHLPVADNSIDVIISNCVINLSTDKHQVFREAYRVLRPGGRLLVSDIVLLRVLPEALRNSLDAYASCIAGAMLKEDYVNAVKAAGFTDVKIVKETHLGLDCLLGEPEVLDLPEELSLSEQEIRAFSRSILSIQLSGRKEIRAE